MNAKVDAPDIDKQTEPPVCSVERKCRVLIVDDDTELCDLLVRYLHDNGFEVFAVGDDVEMETRLRSHPVDLVILDLMLPGKDGLTIARELWAASNIPVIMLSARGDDIDRIIGLEVGADDYLTKPFNPRELLARVRAVLRRRMADVTEHASSPAELTHQFGPFRLDLQAHRLIRNKQEIPLTAMEFKLLSLFVAHPDQLLSRDELMNMLKGYECAPFDRSIDVAVTRLRRKIEDNPCTPRFIRTVRGEGYLFTPNHTLS